MYLHFDREKQQGNQTQVTEGSYSVGTGSTNTEVGVNGSKKRKLVKSAMCIGKFKPPAQSLPLRPVKGPVTKPTVAFMSTYMKPNSSTTVNPTAQVNANVHTKVLLLQPPKLL